MIALLFAAFIVLIVLPPLDVRFRWSLVPWQVSIIGDALVAFSFYIFYLVSKVNTYAAANVRVEEGQKVISTGVYGFVHHPMYFAALFLLIGTATCARIMVDIAFVSCVYTHSCCTYPERRKSTCAELARLRRIYAQRPIPIDSKRLVKSSTPPLLDITTTAAPPFFVRMSQLGQLRSQRHTNSMSVPLPEPDITADIPDR